MSGKPRRAKSSDIKSSDMQRRDEANLGQEEARLEKKKASELSSMSEKITQIGEKTNGRGSLKLLHRACREIEA